MTRRPRHVAVLAGGPSEEREVSLMSGAAVARALRRAGERVTAIDPEPGAWSLPESADVVFLALHGAYGEDGEIQQELDAIGVPYTGCGAEASATAFDKIRAKKRFAEAGVATPACQLIERPSPDAPPNIEFPLVLKPARGGSSLGLAFVDGADDWRREASKAALTDVVWMAEERVVGIEVTVGVLDGAALPIVAIEPRSGAFDYQSKYTVGATDYICPAPLAPGLTRAVQEISLAAFDAVRGRDYGRVDLLIDDAGKAWVLEVNTLPGMTETSLLPMAAAEAGRTFAGLCDRIIELALARSPAPAGKADARER